jgi:hypothetical protein
MRDRETLNMWQENLKNLIDLEECVNIKDYHETIEDKN